MNSNTLNRTLLAGAALGLWLAPLSVAAAPIPRDAIEVLRADLRADRKAIIAEEMKLTEQQSAAFWPIYRSYRAEVDKVSDRFVALVLEYTNVYPNLPEQKAGEMLSQYTRIESDLLSVKRKYLKKLGKVLPASKVFRFAQLDNRYDLGTRVAIATQIPVLPAGQPQTPERR